MRSCPLEPAALQEPAAEPELWASSRSSVLPVKVWGRPVSAVGHSNDDENDDKKLGHLVKKEPSPRSWPGIL